MKMRDVGFLLCGVAIALVLGLARSGADAQTTAETVVPQQTTKIVTTPAGKIIHVEGEPAAEVVSGEDLALRVDRTNDGRVIGTLMARVDGTWRPVELSSLNALAR